MGVILCFGLYQFLLRQFAGISAVIAFVISIVVAILVAGASQYAFTKKNAQVVAFAYAGITGAMTNTLLVMGSILLLYKDAYAKACGVAAEAIVGVIGGVIAFNGVIEAIVAAVIVYIIGVVLNKIKPVAA